MKVVRDSLLLHVVTSRSISSSSAAEKLTPCLLLFISTTSSAKSIFRSSPRGIGLCRSPLALSVLISSTPVIRLPSTTTTTTKQKIVSFMMFHGSSSMLSSSRKTIPFHFSFKYLPQNRFSDTSMLFANFMYLSIRVNRMCFVDDNGSVKYLWDCLGSPSMIRMIPDLYSSLDIFCLALSDPVIRLDSNFMLTQCEVYWHYIILYSC